MLLACAAAPAVASHFCCRPRIMDFILMPLTKCVCILQLHIPNHVPNHLHVHARTLQREQHDSSCVVSCARCHCACNLNLACCQAQRYIACTIWHVSMTFASFTMWTPTHRTIMRASQLASIARATSHARAHTAHAPPHVASRVTSAATTNETCAHACTQHGAACVHRSACSHWPILAGVVSVRDAQCMHRERAWRARRRLQST